MGNSCCVTHLQQDKVFHIEETGVSAIDEKFQQIKEVFDDLGRAKADVRHLKRGLRATLMHEDHVPLDKVTLTMVYMMSQEVGGRVRDELGMKLDHRVLIQKEENLSPALRSAYCYYDQLLEALAREGELLNEGIELSKQWLEVNSHFSIFRSCKKLSERRQGRVLKAYHDNLQRITDAPNYFSYL